MVPQNFRVLIDNYALNAALLSWLLAQVLKVVFTFAMTKKFDAERLFGSGGMPSAHSALSCALTIAISRMCGVRSAEFAIAFVFTCIVMYDAVGVRRQAGKHAAALNRLLDRKEDEPEEEPDDEENEQAEFKELLGHTPLQVLSGALLGILVAMILPA